MHQLYGAEALRNHVACLSKEAKKLEAEFNKTTNAYNDNSDKMVAENSTMAKARAAEQLLESERQDWLVKHQANAKVIAASHRRHRVLIDKKQEIYDEQVKRYDELQEKKAVVAAFNAFLDPSVIKKTKRGHPVDELNENERVKRNRSSPTTSASKITSSNETASRFLGGSSQQSALQKSVLQVAQKAATPVIKLKNYKDLSSITDDEEDDTVVPKKEEPMVKSENSGYGLGMDGLKAGESSIVDLSSSSSALQDSPKAVIPTTTTTNDEVKSEMPKMEVMKNEK